MRRAATHLDPHVIFEVLVRHGVDFVVIGGLGAQLQGSPFPTQDVDIVPEPGADNLARLSAALRELDATVRHPDFPEGLPFGHDATSLAAAVFWNLTTPYGDLDISFTPAGTSGYADLMTDSLRTEAFGIAIDVASLADIVRSKEAAGRPKDQRVLPTLREILSWQERDSGPRR
jgi:hypothetical protein